jgi:X-X-X-Leu-X-X-Gly heptad repeat protein
MKETDGNKDKVSVELADNLNSLANQIKNLVEGLNQ